MPASGAQGRHFDISHDVILAEAVWLDWWERGVAPGWGGGAEDLQAAATSTPPSQPQLKTNPAPANTDVTVLTLSWRNGWQNIWSQIFWATKWLSSCYEVKWWRTDNRWQVEGGATQNLRRQLFIHLGWTLPHCAVWGKRVWLLFPAFLGWCHTWNINILKSCDNFPRM